MARCQTHDNTHELREFQCEYHAKYGSFIVSLFDGHNQKYWTGVIFCSTILIGYTAVLTQHISLIHKLQVESNVVDTERERQL